jgi:hypothetical protein
MADPSGRFGLNVAEAQAPIAGKPVRAALDALEGAWRAAGGRERRLTFGPISVRLRIAGDALDAALMPAVAHALSSGAGDDPVIYAVDARAAGLGPPPRAWPLPERGRDDLAHQHFDDASGFAMLADISRGIWRYGDLRAGRLGYLVEDAATLPDWDLAAPFRHELDWIARGHGMQLSHAAAIGQGGRGILLTGPGGSGKSTTAAAAAMSGWQIAAEDFVLIDDNEAPTAYAAFDTLKLGDFGLALSDRLPPAVANPDRTGEEKARIHMGALPGAAFVPRLSICALAVARVSGAERTVIRPIGKGEAMRALAPSTIFLMKVGREATFRRLVRIVDRLPTYAVDLGRDPTEAATALKTLCP